MAVRACRSHEFCAGHRVVGHEGKCKHLHGHGYVVHFECEADELDNLGRVIDFSVIKARLCEWLEVHWDHRLLLWDQDPIVEALKRHDIQIHLDHRIFSAFAESVIVVPFNPTAENLGLHLLKVIGPHELDGTGVRLVKVRIEETRKCSAEVTS